MNFINTGTLATHQGVPDVRPGTITEVKGTLNDVLDFLAQHNLVLEVYDRKNGPKPNVYYFSVDGQILGAVPETFPAAESGPTREKKGYTGHNPPKPEGYKDGHRWI